MAQTLPGKIADLPNLLRTFGEKLARGKSFRRAFQVGDHSIDIYVSPDAQLKYAKPLSTSFDTDLVNIAQLCVNDGECVWDVGANVGVFSFAAAQTAKTVVSVEADNWLVELLRRSSQLKSNETKDVRILPVAIADKIGFAEFSIASRGRASNALVSAGGNSQMGGERMRTHVPTFSLDSLLDSMPTPDFVKIDVEGAELMALAGASKLIAKIRPTFYIEIANGRFSEAKTFFESHRYDVFDETATLSHGEYGANFFFVPQENENMKAAMANLAKIQSSK